LGSVERCATSARRSPFKYGTSPPTRRRAQYRTFGVSDKENDPRLDSRIEVPKDIFEQVSLLCPALPEVTVRVDASLTRTRSTAHSFDILGRSFCWLVAGERPAGKAGSLLVLRANPGRTRCAAVDGPPVFRSAGEPRPHRGEADRLHRLGGDT
jgi:hypothetical protein